MADAAAVRGAGVPERLPAGPSGTCSPAEPSSVLPIVEHRVLQVLGPGDAFGVTLRIAVIVGLILAMPVLLYQLWAFVSPGLTPSERRALRPWIPLALFFFVLGVSIAYAILPFAIGFL